MNSKIEYNNKGLVPNLGENMEETEYEEIFIVYDLNVRSYIEYFKSCYRVEYTNSENMAESFKTYSEALKYGKQSEVELFRIDKIFKRIEDA